MKTDIWWQVAVVKGVQSGPHSVGGSRAPQDSTGVSAPPEIGFSAPLSTPPLSHWCLIADWEQVVERHCAAQLRKGGSD